MRHRPTDSTPWVALVTLGLGLAVGCADDPSSSSAESSVLISVLGSADGPPATPAPDAQVETEPAPTDAPIDPLGSPEAVAATITEIERAIRDEALEPDETAAWGRSQQRAYQALARRPEWDESVRALLPVDVVPAFDGIVGARRATADHAARRAAERDPGETAPPPSPTLPAWRIVEPPPIEDLLGWYREAEAATGVAWSYLAAIHLVETRMGRIDGVSSAGAVGPMQFLPDTWAACCVGDPLDPRDAILGAATYLVDRGAPADMRGALYGYNPNDGYVGAVEAYASLLAADERAYHGFHAWEVYVGSAAGTVRLPVGYEADEPVDATTWVASESDSLAPLPIERPPSTTVPG